MIAITILLVLKNKLHWPIVIHYNVEILTFVLLTITIIQQQCLTGWWFQPLWKNMLVKIGHLPQKEGKNKHLWNHHLVEIKWIVLSLFPPASRAFTSGTCISVKKGNPPPPWFGGCELFKICNHQNPQKEHSIFNNQLKSPCGNVWPKIFRQGLHAIHVTFAAIKCSMLGFSNCFISVNH